jgi:hypothetical protein
MRIPDAPAKPPKASLFLVRFLPAKYKKLACFGVHTIPVGYVYCLVCHKDWTKGRKYFRFHGTRAPSHHGNQAETTLHIEVTPYLSFHRVQLFRAQKRWRVSWQYKKDLRTAFVRPQIDFTYQNISRKHRLESLDDLVFEDDDE